MKKLLVLFLLAIVLFSLSAKNVQWSFDAFLGDGISYKIDNDDTWHTLDGTIVEANLNGRDEHTLYYKTTSTGERIYQSIWSPKLSNELSLSYSPYSLYLFTSNSNKVISNYTFGLSTEYQYRPNKDIGFGFEARYSLASLEKDKGLYSDLKIGFIGSYKHNLNKSNYLLFSLSAGVDAIFYATSPETFFYMALSGGYGIKINNKLSFVASLRSDMTVINGSCFGFEFIPDFKLVCYF